MSIGCMSKKNDVSSFWASQWKAQASHSAERTRAWEYFLSKGMPEAKNEAWLNFTTRPLEKLWPLSTGESKLTDAMKADLDLLPEDCSRLVLIDGQFSKAASSLDGWTLSEGTGKDFNWNDGAEALYQAFSRAEIKLVAKEGSRPLAIYHFQTRVEEFHPITLKLEIPRNQKAEVLECWSSGVDAWSGCLLEVNVSDGAQLEWVRRQTGPHHMSAERFTIAANASLNWLGLQADAGWSRVRCDVDLVGEGASASLFGLSFGQEKNQLDSRIQISHLSPNTKSSQLFKSIVRDHAKSVFAGRINIAAGAQKSDASQKHQGLTLHSTAECVTQPELEVRADDVKAAHGATIGRLDDDELFYLETRGISKQRAMELLARAFVEDVLSHIKNKEFYRFMDQRLEKGISSFLQLLEQKP
jgi:Fe-S cluster assembly protein SufD